MELPGARAPGKSVPVSPGHVPVAAPTGIADYVRGFACVHGPPNLKLSGRRLEHAANPGDACCSSLNGRKSAI